MESEGAEGSGELGASGVDHKGQELNSKVGGIPASVTATAENDGVASRSGSEGDSDTSSDEREKSSSPANASLDTYSRSENSTSDGADSGDEFVTCRGRAAAVGAANSLDETERPASSASVAPAELVRKTMPFDELHALVRQRWMPDDTKFHC